MLLEKTKQLKNHEGINNSWFLLLQKQWFYVSSTTYIKTFQDNWIRKNVSTKTHTLYSIVPPTPCPENRPHRRESRCRPTNNVYRVARFATVKAKNQTVKRLCCTAFACVKTYIYTRAAVCLLKSINIFICLFLQAVRRNETEFYVVPQRTSGRSAGVEINKNKK